MDGNNNKMDFEDVYSDSSNKQPTYERGRKPLEQREICYPNKFIEFMAKNNKKNTKRILIGFIVALALLLVALVADFINDKLNLINYEDELDNFGTVNTEEYDNFEDAQFDAMHDITDAGSLDDLLKKWYQNNGEKMHQDYITNVLLIGCDAGGLKSGNSDSLILVSINRKTETITLTSMMRDSRTYFEVNGRGYCQKINASYARGGASATVETLEKNLKIEIDHYVAVDFGSFPKLIDALGGVTVDMKEYEQKYINRTTTKIKKIPNYGEVKLDGKQALVYARIRKCDADSDVSRTRRQRTLITSIIKSAKGASLSQINSAVDSVLPYLLTDCTKTEILSYGAKAVAQAWYNYKIEQVAMPDADCRRDARLNGISYWIVDYPLVAQRVQQAIYGTTNIQLDANRVTAFNYIVQNSGSSSSSSNSSSVASSSVAETTTKRSIIGWLQPSDSTTASTENTTGATETPTGSAEPSTAGSTVESTTKPIIGWFDKITPTTEAN